MVENDNVGYSCINSMNLLILDPVSCIANRISFALHFAKSSASDKVAHLNFVIPRSSCILIISAILWVLICGLSFSVPPAIFIINLIFSSILLGKTTKEGDGISSTLFILYQSLSI